MTKRRMILAGVLGLLMALCLSLAVACGGEEAETETIKWTIGGETDHVTVTVNDSTELPETYTVGETLTFKVLPDSGYEVTVKNGRTALNGENGVYSIEVKKGKSANEIIITVTKTISTVAVTKNPARMTYYAGEELDTEGMEVTVTYATGETENVEKGYVVNYPTEAAGCFTFGDSYFTVTYGSKTSENVNLEQAVVGRITLDLQGGKLSDDYLAKLTENTDISKHEKSGTLYYIYFDAALTAGIALPAAAEISRETETGEPISFIGWRNGTAAVSSIPQTAIGGTYTAKWAVDLVSLSNVKYEVGEGEDAGKVFLVITGTYHMADSVYLYFYEGNAQVEWKGDTYSGKIGETFNAKYDMTQLASAKTEDGGNYLGKWMDIKLVASVEGVEDIQEINLLKYGEDFVDLSQTAHNDKYVFSFQTHEPGIGQRLLKAVANNYVPPITLSGDDTNLIVSGTLDATYADMTVTVDYYGTDTQSSSTTVAADGSYSVSFPFENMPLKTTMYFHFVIKDSNGAIVLQGDSDNNLLNAWLATDESYVPGEKLGSLNGIRTRIANSDNSKVLYIGYGEWNAVVGWVVDETWSATNAAFETRGDGDAQKGYFVLSGTWDQNYFKDKDAATKKFEELFASPDFQNLPQLSVASEWTTWQRTAEDNTRILEVSDDGTWKLLLELPTDSTDPAVQDGQVIFIHSTNGSNLYVDTLQLSEDSLTLGKLEYSFVIPSGLSGDSDAWANGLLCIKISDPTAKTIKPTSDGVELVEEEGKPCIVVTVTAQNYTEDELKNAVQYGNKDGSYEWKTPCIKVVKDGEKYKLFFDLTNMQVGSDGQLWSNLFVGENKLEIKDADCSSNGKTITVAGKKYTIICTGENGTWYIPCIKVEDATEG